MIVGALALRGWRPLRLSAGGVTLRGKGTPGKLESAPMTTRQSELQRVLTNLSREIPKADWVALVDQNGLMVSSVPAEPPVDSDRVAAMTAAVAQTAERVLAEIEGGDPAIRNRDGFPAAAPDGLPESRPAAGHRPAAGGRGSDRHPVLMRWVPELLQVLKRRYSSE